MTDELQNDEQKLSGSLDSDDNAQKADLAPATGDDQSKDAENKGDDKLSENALKAINKQHFKYQEEKRRAEALEKEKADIEARLKALEVERGEVVVPDIPDQFDFDTDEEYRSALLKREEAIAEKARIDARKELEQIQAQTAEKQKQAEVQQQQQALLRSYADNAATLGVNIDELSAAEKVVNMYNIDSQVSEYVMKDTDGPLVVQYLANNPLMLDEIARMSPIEAVLKINSEIKPTVSELKAPSAAPPPPESLDGVGAPETMDPLIAGGKFE